MPAKHGVGHMVQESRITCRPGLPLGGSVGESPVRPILSCGYVVYLHHVKTTASLLVLTYRPGMHCGFIFQAEDASAPRKRTFRTFSYRGVDLEKLVTLPLDKLVDLFRARQRRKFSRGINMKALPLMNKLRNAKKDLAYGEKPPAVNTHLRNVVVVPEMIGSIIGVYNGKQFINVEIKVRRDCTCSRPVINVDRTPIQDLWAVRLCLPATVVGLRYSPLFLLHNMCELCSQRWWVTTSASSLSATSLFATASPGLGRLTLPASFLLNKAAAVAAAPARCGTSHFGFVSRRTGGGRNAVALT